MLLATITISFFIARLAPGGPFDEERPLHPKVKANLEKHYNLDKPLAVQYLIYLSGVIRGDLGPSFTSFNYTVSERLVSGMGYTLIIGGIAFLLATVIGILTGTYTAIHANKYSDIIVSVAILLSLTIPNFLMAAIVQEHLALNLGWFKVSGFKDVTREYKTIADYLSIWQYLTLPIAVLSLPYAARISRLMRGSMIETLLSPYIRTARAKGIGEAKVIFRHAFKQAVTPVISYLGPAASFILTGSLVIESIFAIPGIGRYFVDAALNRDYGMVLGTVIFYIFLILILNLFVDLTYSWLNPQVRFSEKS